MRSGAQDEGQATVELALVLPLVAMLFLVLVQVTSVARTQVVVVHAARAGAREAGRVGAGTESRARATVIDSAAAAGLDPSRLDVRIQRLAGTQRLVSVEVVYVTPTDVPLVGSAIGDVPIRAKAVIYQEST